MWWLYIIRCADASLYTGITTDVERRFSEHESGKGAKYCRGRAPLELVYTKQLKDRSEASKEEIRVKKLSKKSKLKLVASYKTVL